MPKKRRPSPPLTIKAVKAKGYSPAYEKRLINAIRKARKQGKKPTRQAARGHKKAEHVERREKEKVRFGLTGEQIRAIRQFVFRFNKSGYKDIPDEVMLVDFARENGYERFVQYRKTWDAARKQYVSELQDGTWESRGLQYLNHLTGMAKAPDNQWLYYH